MDRNQIKDLINKSEIFSKWHWFQYHFEYYKHNNVEHPLAKSIIDCCLICENAVSDMGQDYIKKIADINGNIKFEQHYEQLIQVLAELLIVSHTVNYSWPEQPKYIYEPAAVKGGTNPELMIKFSDWSFLLEVKAPNYFKLNRARAQGDIQLLGRSNLRDSGIELSLENPRDNSFKDFLESADKKFKPFKDSDSNCLSVLFHVGDDWINEPIAYLNTEESGLFTRNSFAKKENQPFPTFANVDLVILSRHLLPIVKGTRDEYMPLDYNYTHPLDYGLNGNFPFKALYGNPFVNFDKNAKMRERADIIAECYQAYTPDETWGAEYKASSLVLWVKNQKPSNSVEVE